MGEGDGIKRGEQFKQTMFCPAYLGNHGRMSEFLSGTFSSSSSGWVGGGKAMIYKSVLVGNKCGTKLLGRSRSNATYILGNSPLREQCPLENTSYHLVVWESVWQIRGEIYAHMLRTTSFVLGAKLVCNHI